MNLHEKRLKIYEREVTMEPKCNYCDFFGEKYHCHNCRIFNGAREHVPQEIACSIEEFIQTIENEEHLDEVYEVGDYIYVEAYTGEKLKVVVLDHNKDIIANANGKTAKISLGILDVDGYFQMNPESTNEGGWTASQMRRRMEKFFRILPEPLKSHIIPVVKKHRSVVVAILLTAPPINYSCLAK